MGSVNCLFNCAAEAVVFPNEELEEKERETERGSLMFRLW